MTLLLLLFLLLLLLLYPVWVVHRQTLGMHEKVEKSPAEWGEAYEDIAYETTDGVVLRGWWVPAEGDEAVLLIHGNGGSRNGFTSGIFELGKWYRKRGFTVMMVDLRAHGESGGERIYFGVKESSDLLGWVEAIDSQSRFAWTIHGFSMGAVTALMMKEKAPAKFKKIVADAPWIDFHALVKQELWKRAHLPPLCYGYVRFLAKRVLGIDFNAADNRERCRKLCGEKNLYIFETEDRLVTPLHEEALKRVCPEAEIFEFAGAAHVEAFKEDPDRYLKKIESFVG